MTTRSTLVVGLALCTACRDDSGDDRVAELEAELQALQAQVDSMESHALREDLDALGSRVDSQGTLLADLEVRLLTLEEEPETLDASDALALALCHLQRAAVPGGEAGGMPPRLAAAVRAAKQRDRNRARKGRTASPPRRRLGGTSQPPPEPPA